MKIDGNEQAFAQQIKNEPATGTAKMGRTWLWIFCLMMVWVYTMRTCSAFLMVMGGMADHFMAIGIFAYPVEILGVCFLPAFLDRLGIGTNAKKNQIVFIALTALTLLSLAFITGQFFISGFYPGLAINIITHYLLILSPATMMGLALRRGVMLWNPQKSILYVGGAYTLYMILDAIIYFSFNIIGDPYLYMHSSIAIFMLLPAIALYFRVRNRDDFQEAMPDNDESYPKSFLIGIGGMMVLHAFFSTFINTVYYFENMDDFHTLGYEIFFHILAIIVIATATWLLYKRQWLATAAVCLLILCLAQGLTLFGIESMPLAIGYNITTMVTKMPLFILGLVVPVYFCATRRKPGGLVCLGFALSAGADFLLQLTQLTPQGMSSIPRQGVLLLAGLVLTGLLFYYYLRFTKTRTAALLASIQKSQSQQKSPKEVLDELNLTNRENEIAGLLLDGDSSKIIAGKLHISHATVTFHTKNLYRKLNIQSRSELFALFIPT